MTLRGETFLSHEPMIAVTDEPSLASKIAFLSRPDSYGDPARTVSRRETHMSWVFLAGDRVFKLKKPVCFPYLDFSTLARREAACRAELRLNRRLAADVYLGVVPLVWTPCGLAIGGSGVTVDWLVVMRRLDEALTLERMILDCRLTDRDLDRLLGTLTAFYLHAGPVRITPARHFADWERNLNDNRRVLFESRRHSAGAHTQDRHCSTPVPCDETGVVRGARPRPLYRGRPWRPAPRARLGR